LRLIFVSTQTQKLGDVHDLCFYLKALAASGLRALRYAKEVAEVGSVVACDNDKVAVEACERNIRLNGKVAMAKLTAHHADSRIYMLSHEKEFDVVSTISK
jgi:tRNA (guanine26-N2/guanine27-N2)-dimethyltransferase